MTTLQRRSVGQWWSEGLWGWLSQGARRHFSQRSVPWTLHVDETSYRFHGAEGPVYYTTEAMDWDQLAVQVKRGTFARWVIRFPATQALSREITLPLAAEKNLRQVLGFEMDRFTPFPATQVYYDAVVRVRKPEQRQLRVTLTVLPRTVADVVLTPLRQRGVMPDVLTVVGAPEAINLLPPDQRPQRGCWARRIQAMVLLLSALLIIAAGLLPIYQQRALVIATQAAVAKTQGAAQQAMALRDQLDQLANTSQVLTQRKQATPPKVTLLCELTRLLPDDTWVERLTINGENVQIVGQSAKASALVGLIEGSPLFKDARFLSPVNTDNRSGKERFSLGAKIDGQ